MPLHRPPAHSQAATAALAAITVFFALVQVLTLSSGVIDVRFSASMAWIVALASAAGAALVARAYALRGAPGGSARPAIGRWYAPLRVVIATATTAGVVGWAASVWLRLWTIALQRPPYDWDGLYYHLPALNAWVVHGRVTWLAGVTDVPFVNYPMGVEAFTFFVHQMIPRTALASALNLWYWPLGLLGVVAIASRIGAKGPWPWLAGALLAGVPVVVCQSVTAYVDPAFAFTVIGALSAVLIFVLDDDRPSWASIVLLGASAGLVAGGKGTGAPFAVTILVGALAGAYWLRPAQSFARWSVAVGAAAVVAGLVGGYWYVRNFIYTGNPLHPVELRIGALVLSPGYDPVAITESNLPEWLRQLPAVMRAPASWLQLDAPIQGYSPVGGLGYLWIAFGVPAIALVASRIKYRAGDREPSSADGVILMLGLVAVLFVIQPSAWWSRFTIWLHALGLPALALSLQWLVGDAGRVRRKLGLAALFLVVGVSVWESERTLAIESQRGRVEPGPYEATMDAIFPGFGATEGVDRLLATPRVGRSTWSRMGTLLGGALALPLGARELDVLPAHPTAADLERSTARGVSWIIWDELAAGPVPDVIAARALETHTWRLGNDAVFHLVRITD